MKKNKNFIVQNCIHFNYQVNRLNLMLYVKMDIYFNNIDNMRNCGCFFFGNYPKFGTVKLTYILYFIYIFMLETSLPILGN